ncbi:MAG: glycosyltransferase [Acidobacteriota bacterium]
MNNPLISIIIPCFNCEKYVEQAILNAKSQRLENLEIVFINDGSTDNVEELLQPYKNDLVYCYQENKGLSNARNKGIEFSKGNYIAFLDPDDIWYPDTLITLYDFLENNKDFGMVCGKTLCISESGEPLYSIPPKNIGPEITHEDLLNRNLFTVISALARRECFEKVGLFDENLTSCEDYDMWLRISKHYKIGYIDKYVAKYRIASSMMSADIFRMVKNEVAVLEKNLIVDENTPKKVLSHLYYKKGVFNSLLKNQRKSTIYFFSSLKNNPFNYKSMAGLFLNLFFPFSFEKIMKIYRYR